ncbi:hypothetical protein [Maritimibacter fusiformis]|uniref:Uncharacterized protein n=1 Tax=Maritimibacter fusiformis TaxID=2603819 RepID=A0A5D0RRG3_9RHOB|nr:hypothetical protein [Maritimibacter fusiformis]TYB83278.1 hypothetical protein FVF75_03620 [Maritimibacter fusiformis]
MQRWNSRASHPSEAYLWVVSSLLGILVLSPLSQVLFKFDFGYSVEIPIVVVALVAILWPMRITLRFARGLFLGFACGSMALIPFVLFAALNGVTFQDYYPDFRALLLLIVTLAGLHSVTPKTGLKIAYRTCAATIGFTGLLYLLVRSGVMPNLIEHGFSGKYFPPIFPALVLALFFARRKARLVPIFGIALLAMMASTTSYRQVLVIAALLIIGILHATTVRLSGRLSPITNTLLVVGTAMILFKLSQLPSEQIGNALLFFGKKLTAVGIDPRTVEQLFYKTARSLAGQTPTGGDGDYLVYLENLFNVPHFALPHGLGQAVTYGDPDIWGGNTIDNSMIFFNYHFSAFIAIPLLVLFVIWKYFAMSNSSWSMKLSLLPIIISVSFFLYFRAWPFVASDAAIGFGMLLFSGRALAGTNAA